MKKDGVTRLKSFGFSKNLFTPSFNAKRIGENSHVLYVLFVLTLFRVNSKYCLIQKDHKLGTDLSHQTILLIFI